MAAVLAAGPAAVISHRTAAAALGIAATASALIDVTIPTRSGRCRRAGVRLHHSPGLAPTDTTWVDGIPCTTAARTLLDLAAVVSAAELARAVEAAEKRRVFNGRAIEELVDRAAHHPGAGRLRVALAVYREPPPTRQEFERRAFEVFARAGLPRPGVNVLVDTAAERLEVDFCWPDRRLVVEADSWEHHGTRAAFERDRRRDQLLHAAGWACVRITWRQLRDAPEEVVAALCAGRP